MNYQFAMRVIEYARRNCQRTPQDPRAKTVEIIDVGSRDDLQIESQILSTSERLRMIDADAGLNEIEAGTFVNPKAVPQMKGGTLARYKESRA